MLRRPVSKTVPLIIFTLALNSLSSSVCMAALSPKELDSKIQEAKILQPGDRISSAIRTDEVIIHKYKAADSTATEKDCKIEAVLIGRVVLTADSNIKKVKVRFFERNDPTKYSEVVVQPIHIKSFASGAISQEDLLSSLELSHGVDAAAAARISASTQAEATPSSQSNITEPDGGVQGVSEGPLFSQRKELLGRIKKLSDQGVNTQTYTKSFLLMDECAKKQDTSGTALAFEKLDGNVNDQQKALDRKQKGQSTPRTTQQASADTSANTATTESNSTGISLGDLSNLNVEKLAKIFEQKYGAFTPLPGPYQEERNYISSVLIKRQNMGYQVKQFEPMCKELNYYAKANDAATLRSKITNAYRFLQIPSLHEYMKSQGGYGGRH